MERSIHQRSATLDAFALAERPLLPQEVLDAASTAGVGYGHSHPLLQPQGT